MKRAVLLLYSYCANTLTWEKDISCFCTRWPKACSDRCALHRRCRPAAFLAHHLLACTSEQHALSPTLRALIRSVNPEHRKTPPDLNRFVAMTKPWRLLGAVKRWPAVKHIYVHDGSSISSNICVRIPPDSKPRTSEDTPRSKPLCRHDKALTASRSCEEVASRKAYLCAWRE